MKKEESEEASSGRTIIISILIHSHHDGDDGDDHGDKDGDDDGNDDVQERRAGKKTK